MPAPGDYDHGEIGGLMIGRETEVLGENLPQCREPGPSRWEASD
jgi:hypothetical protein